MSEFPRRQRIGAYAVVRRQGETGEEILLTQMASRTGHMAGIWTLPGGGIEHGEDPRACAVREVHEETGLDVEITGILDVTFTHWVGVRENGVGEDYHGVHLVFSADLLPHSVGVTPRVTEADSSTQVAAWVPVDDAKQLRLLAAAAKVLGVPRA